MHRQSTALFLTSLLGIAALHCARGALCENYTTVEECTGKIVDTGNCVWQASNSTCVSDGSPLPPDTAAITAVEGPPSEDIGAQGPAGDVILGGGPVSENLMYPELLPTDDAFCTQPAERGPCRASLPAWYWDATAKTCKQFMYGGCDGNDNVFETEEACIASSEEFCGSAVVEFSNPPTNNTFCTQPAETGPCRANIQAWFWDDSTKACKEFTYGGCKGNDNAFETEETCIASSKEFCSSAVARGGIYALVVGALALLVL